MKYNYSQEELEKKKKEVLDKVVGLNNEYEKILPTLDDTNKNGFRLLDKDTTSDATLKKRAEEQANLEYETKKAKAQDSTKQKSLTLSQAINAILEESEKKKQDTSKEYDTSKNRVEEDASKRGIARSSIANGMVADLEGKKLAELDEIDNEASEKSNDIKAQIADLQNKLTDLIAQYELERSVSAEAKFANAKEKRDTRNDAVDKYNNSIRQFEVENNQKLKYSPADKSAAKAVKVEYDKKKVAEVVNFYNSFEDKSKALEDFLSNDELREALGDNYEMCLRLIYQG